MYTPVEQPEYALTRVGLSSAAVVAMPQLAIASIAGRDSIAAAVVAVRELGFRTLLPVSVGTGTEYGDESERDRSVDTLARLLEGEAEVLPHIRVGSPRLWAALNGRFASVIAGRYRIYSPCLACHLYVHLARVPLAQLLEGVPIITGERDSHGGKVKLSQTPLSIEAETRVLARAGIRLLTPVRRFRDAEKIVAALGPSWTQSSETLDCVHSGNYKGLDGCVAYDELAYARYVHGFFEPVGTAVVDAWRENSEPNYEAIVASVLAGPDAA
jgi:hypothetical protein